jgi:hypothetical protein
VRRPPFSPLSLVLSTGADNGDLGFWGGAAAGAARGFRGGVHLYSARVVATSSDIGARRQRDSVMRELAERQKKALTI